MSIGSLSAGTTATSASADSSARARETAAPTIADHVAADQAQEPTPNVSATLGTLVDTYL